MEVFLNEQECAINGGVTRNYFKLQKTVRQGNPVSAYLFILCLKILFMLIKNNINIKGNKIFEKVFLYAAYADGSTFFLNVKTQLKNY